MPPPPSPSTPQLRFSAAWNGMPLVGVHRVTGLRRIVDVLEYQEGGAPAGTPTSKLPGDISYDPVSIERPVTGDATFARLADAAAPPTPGTDHRGTLTVQLHDQAGNPVLACTLHRAWVSSYDVFAELDAHSDDPVVERITVVFESWQLTHTAP